MLRDVVVFKHTTSVKLHDTDAAGTLFFVNQFRFAQEAFEDFLESVGFAIGHIFQQSEILLPVVHASADYLKPVVVGEKISIHLTSQNIKETSFGLVYSLYNEKEEEVGRVQTVHVVVARSGHPKRRPIPERLRRALESIRQPVESLLTC